MFNTQIRKTVATVALAIGSFLAYADAVKVRLQFVFDAGAMDYISQAGANYDDFAASCVTRMNTVLANSRLNGYFTYELAGTTLLPGVDNTNPATGYAEGWAALNGNRGSEWAGMLQDLYNNAADVVVLLINTGSYAGATGNSHPYTGTGAEYAINYAGSAFSVCSIMTAAREIEGIASAHQVLSHEVAHTIGCGHPDTQDRQPGPQSSTYASGLQFKLPAGKETALPRSASVTRDLTAYYGTTLMGYSERFFKNVDGTYMTRAEVLAETGWTDADEGEKYWDNTDGSYGTGYPNGVWVYCYIVPYFSSPNLYFSTVTIPYGQEVTSGVVTVYDQTQYDAMSAADKAKVVPMGDATHNNRQVLIDNCQYASKWHLGVKFSKDGNESVVNGKSDKITLTPLSKNLSIYYTTDGTEPTKSNGTLYTAPFSLTQAATVKARSYDANDNAGDVLSKSYTMLPLATAIGNTELTWTTTSPEWYANNGVARSGNINSDGVSSTLSTVIKGPAQLTFDYVAELMDYDVFTVTVGGNEVFRHTGYQSTQTPSGEIVIPAGDQTVEFTCTVNFNMGYGMNHVNLYDVSVAYDYDPDAPEDPEDPGVAAPVPAAVWENDFSSEALVGFDGFSIEDWQQTHGENNSSVTIDRNNQGLFVDFTEAKGYVTVLVKYSNLSASSSLKRVLFATTASSNYNYDRCGLRLLTDSTVQGLWNNQTASNNDADYGTASTGTVPSAGTLAFVYDKTSGSDAGGLSAYAAGSGASLSDAALWINHALKAGDIYGFAVGGMCRNASASGAEAAKGMTITGLAVFTNVLTVAEMNAYVWPSEEPEIPQYEGPAPTAVWVAGEFGDDRSAHAGLEVSLNGNTTNAMGQIVIGGSTVGATIAIPEGFDNATMLVKYSIPSGGAPAANSVPASMFVNYDMGAYANSGASALDGYWWNNSQVRSGYALSSPAPSIPQEGYILISTPANANNNAGNHYTAVYVGETVADLVGGEASGLRFTHADNRVTKVGIGGPTVAGAVPWAGMVIKGVALFDEWVTTNVIANYTFPAQGAVRPVDSDRYAIEPDAAWVNDFKTAAKGDYTLSVSGTTAAKDDTFGGTLTIGDAAAVVDVSNGANGGNVTVLVKYRASPATANAPVVTFGETLSNGVKIDVGAYTQSARSLAVNRSYNGGNNKWVALKTAASLNENGGYLLCARKYNDMMVYVGDSLDSMTGGATAAPGDIQFSCDLIQAVGIGGPSGLPNADSAWSPFAGFEVEKVVVFNGYYTPDQIRYVPNPEDADTLSIASGVTWKFAAGETKTYTNIGTLNAGGTIAITNASTLAEGAYKLAEWTTPQIMSSGYGRVGTLTTEGLPAGLTAELVYGVKAIYLRVYDAAAYAARPKLRIMPYGDSITEGFNLGDSKANYRVLLGQKLAMLGYNVEMVGCYNKIQKYSDGAFVDAIDPSGVGATNIWQWHSAKHGATLGVTALTSYQRSALTENVDTICAQAGRPDAVLLLGGINDLSPGFDAPATVFANWTNVVMRLVTNLPDSKIIVTTTLHAGPGRTDSLNSNADGFNTLVKNYLSSMPAGWVGHVEFVDLCDVVKSAETGVISSDNLHPDWLGDDQMAEGWLSVITNVYPSANGTFPSATPLPTVVASELGAAAKSELADYRAGFKLCRTITPTANIDTANPYSATGEGATEDFEKVAYFVEYVRADNNAHKWVWVDMDAFGDADLASVGLPAANRQQVVTKLHVKSNHNGIEDVAADDDTVSGWIEFSPFGYGGAASGVSGAPTAHGGNDKSMYDWNDTLTSGGTYGSMQVFRTAPSTGRPAQVLFAYNNWRDATSEAEFGIGNFAQHFWGGAQTLDYTYTKGLPQMNASAYSVKRIEIWTKTAEPENPDERDLTAEEIAGGKTLTRLNGKVYCGNDANRAVITNYLSQLEGTRPLTSPAPHTVDLLIVFDKPSADYALNTAGVSLEEFAARNVAKMNYILTRTDIDTNVWFRLAGVYPIEATAANHTDAMSKGQQSSAPGWEMVHAARDRVGADVVISLYDGAEGMAYRCTPAGIKSGSEAVWAFCGVGHSDLNATRGWTWVHEVAHTASLYHNIAGAVGNNDPYYVGCGFGATIGGKWCSTVMNYEPTEDAFSSANHKLNGEIYSITNSAGAYLDASGVLAELLPYMANYRATVVPEGVVVNATPLDEAIVASGATMTLSCNDPDATIYYYNASLGETEANAVEYSAPVAITPGNPLLGMAQYYVFAKKNGVKVTAADAIIDYKVAGSMLVPDNPAEILDMSGLSWSVGDGWTKTTEQSCKGGSAYVCAPSAAAACSLKTTITVDADKTLVFHHIDNFAEGASFVVWVDDMPVWYKKGVNSTSGKWVEDSVILAQGSHTIEFAFTGNGSTLYLDYLSLDRFTTTTGFPVPYSWIEACFPGIEGYPAAMYETMAKSSGTNGYPYWESYVLGLEPTNTLSTFIATIRMEGQKPIVEYSPTNEVLKASGAIEYILQGKPVLSNSWQNVTFEDPGTTNRFFRVKVEW